MEDEVELEFEVSGGQTKVVSCFKVELRLLISVSLKRGGTWHLEVVKKAIFSANMCLSNSPMPSLALRSR